MPFDTDRDGLMLRRRTRTLAESAEFAQLVAVLHRLDPAGPFGAVRVYDYVRGESAEMRRARRVGELLAWHRDLALGDEPACLRVPALHGLFDGCFDRPRELHWMKTAAASPPQDVSKGRLRDLYLCAERFAAGLDGAELCRRLEHAGDRVAVERPSSTALAEYEAYASEALFRQIAAPGAAFAPWILDGPPDALRARARAG